MEGQRHNEGKLRYDLVHPAAHEGMVQVLTFGADKYEPRNWEKGMPWSTVIASLKRHIAEIEKGEDFDKESGLLHIDHVACNAHFLGAYYRDHTECDDRPRSNQPRIALDIDEVIAGFVIAYCNRYPDVNRNPAYWRFDRQLPQRLEELKDDRDFWVNEIKPITTIPFEPVGYVTARNVDPVFVEEWLSIHNLPEAPVKVVGVNGCKAKAIKDLEADIFVDDSYQNFESLIQQGINCYLMDKPWNRRYNVGYRRIKSLEELVTRRLKVLVEVPEFEEVFSEC